jgi:acyl-CoA dehydrogenase
MHNHLLAALVWRRKNQKAPVEPLLKRIVAEQIVLISSGGSDWLNGSGAAEKVENGYKFNGRKIFASASPVGDLLMTTAVVQDPVKGPTVIHFPMSFKSPELKILDTWHVMGMRGTGSHDLEIKDFFVPETSVAVQRPQGKWHPAMHVVAKIAIPIIYSVYYGLAETARNIAIQQCIKKRSNIDTQILIGEMENELTSARLAWDAMVNLGSTSTPGDETTNQVMIYRGLLTRSVIQTVNKAMEAVGGASFYRSLGLERIFRDIQGAKFHPLQEKPQIRHAGRFALGLPSDE